MKSRTSGPINLQIHMEYCKTRLFSVENAIQNPYNLSGVHVFSITFRL